MLGCLQLGSLQPPRLLAPWALEGHPAGWGVLEGLGGSSEELGAFLFLRRGQASQKEVGPVCPWLVASDLGRATWPGLSAVPWAGAWTKPLAPCPMPPILGASVSQLRRGGGCVPQPPAQAMCPSALTTVLSLGRPPGGCRIHTHIPNKTSSTSWPRVQMERRASRRGSAGETRCARLAASWMVSQRPSTCGVQARGA